MAIWRRYVRPPEEVGTWPGWEATRRPPSDLLAGYGGERGRGSQYEHYPEGPHCGLGPRGYRRSDERMREDICEVMTRNSHLDASDIEVRVSGGEATLSGTVNGRSAKRLAEDIAESVVGITDVHNQLRLAGAGG